MWLNISIDMLLQNSYGLLIINTKDALLDW